MSWDWLLFAVAASAVVNWPWLILLAGWSWALSIGHWPLSPWLLVGQLAGVLAAEAILIAWSRRIRTPEFAVTTLEGAALAGFALLWGTIAGTFAWQISLGFDAVGRLRALRQSAVRLMLIRGARVVLGLAFVALYAYGW
jgi:hypothetical protein